MAKINDDGFLELSGVRETGFSDVLNAADFPILASLSPLSLRVLNQASHIIHVAKGVKMMDSGDTPHDLYFIKKGSVSIGKRTKGEMKAVTRLFAGDFYGEYGVLRGKTRFAAVYTAELCELVRVNLKTIQQVFNADQCFHDDVFNVMQERLLSSFLFSHPVFKSLPEVLRKELSKNLKVTELERDKMLFREGDVAEQYYFILSGEAEVTVSIEGAETVVEVKRENGVLGEVRTDEGKVYAYGAYAANSLDLLSLDKDTMQAIQKLSPETIPLLNQLIKASARNTSDLIREVLDT